MSQLLQSVAAPQAEPLFNPMSPEVIANPYPHYHRLRTLDVDGLDPYVDLAHFDGRAFFVERSRPLTL